MLSLLPPPNLSEQFFLVTYIAQGYSHQLQFGLIYGLMHTNVWSLCVSGGGGGQIIFLPLPYFSLATALDLSLDGELRTLHYTTHKQMPKRERERDMTCFQKIKTLS